MITEDIATELANDFFTLANIPVEVNFMPMGMRHSPTRLAQNERGVYVLFREQYCFKVGKANSNSQARWNSHHYNLDESTESQFPRKFMNDIDNFKLYFPEEMRPEIESLNSNNIRNWVQNNLARIEFKLVDINDLNATSLLESLVQFRLRPIYEGRLNHHQLPSNG